MPLLYSPEQMHRLSKFIALEHKNTGTFMVVGICLDHNGIANARK